MHSPQGKTVQGGPPAVTASVTGARDPARMKEERERKRSIRVGGPGTPRRTDWRSAADMATLEAGRASLQERRLAVPFPLIRMVERGLERPVGARGTEGWWRWVESRMHRFVRGQLPRGATCVRLALDEDTLDVIVHFRSAGPGSAPLRRADPSPNG